MCRHNHRQMLILTVLITVLLVAGSTLAQAQQGNRAGFFIGLNFANQGGDMDEIGQTLADEVQAELGGSWSSSKGANMGWGLGGFYTIQTSPTFGVQIEGQYIRRGAKLELTGSSPGLPSVDAEIEFQANYLEIPVLARFSFSPEANIRPVLMVGPVIGFKTGANMKMTLEGESDSESISDGYKSTTVGLLGSVGISAQVGDNKFLTAHARYYQGLTNPIDDPQLEAKAGDIGIFLGMEFLLSP